MLKILLSSLIIATTIIAQSNAFEIAEMHMKQKNYKEAIKNYQAVIKQSTNYEPAWFGLQNAYIQNGELNNALKLVNINLSARLRWGQIRVLFYSGQFDTIPQLIFDLAHIYPKSEFINDALELGIIIAQVKADTVSLRKYAQAMFNLETKNYDEGIKIIRELIVKPNILTEYSYLLLSKLFVAKNEFNQAIGTLKEFSLKFQKSKLYPKVRYELGLIYLESIKDTIMAKDIFEDLISDFPESPESYFARSQLFSMRTENKSK